MICRIRVHNRVIAGKMDETAYKRRESGVAWLGGLWWCAQTGLQHHTDDARDRCLIAASTLLEMNISCVTSFTHSAHRCAHYKLEIILHNIQPPPFPHLEPQSVLEMLQAVCADKENRNAYALEYCVLICLYN